MDQGITWDEPTYVNTGIVYIQDVIHLDFSHDSWNMNLEHPTFGKFLYGAAVVLLHHGLYDYQSMFIGKALSALMGALTCAMVYLIGREFFTRRVGAAAAIVLALIPVFVANNQQAALDTPLALFFTVTMFLFMLAVKSGDWRIYAISAVSLGVLVDTKFNGLLIVPVMALFYLINRFMRRSSGMKQDTLLTLAGAIGFTAIAGLTLYALWPWIWNSPENLVSSLDHWGYAPQEYFLGTLQAATPIYYPVYFMVTTPALLLIPFFIGIYSLARSKDPYKYALLLWCFIPFCYGLSHMVQDGMRYLLMIYPAVALICAAGLLEAAGWASKLNIGNGLKKAAFPALVALTALYLIVSLATIYPYYLDYYNVLSGGSANVDQNRQFEFGWWGEGLSDSILYIETHAAHRSMVYLAVEPPTSVHFYSKNCTYESADNVYFGGETDYVLVNAYEERYDTVVFNRPEYQLVYETTVQGMPLVKVYKNIHDM
jgi:hypothetical protein